jgi:hypothetical protein
MKNVVREATGHQVGFNYRTGYFEGGAVEVSAAEAANGDIVQISDDSNTSPWASYPGLHTAIILENLGGGRFNAVDSNQNWDEMVRLRPNYDPYAGAARYGLDVHIYRFPGGSSAPATAATAVAAPTDSRTWAAGDSATVDASPGCLNMRASATLGASIATCLTHGTAVTVIGGPVNASGHTWVQVQTPAGAGWVATGYLQRSAAPAPVSAPVAEPAPAQPVAEPEAVAPPPAAAEPAPAPVAAAAAVAPAPDIWYTDNSPGCLRVRDVAGLGGSILDCLPGGTRVTVVPGQRADTDGHAWVLADSEGRPRGWVAAEYLIR